MELSQEEVELVLAHRQERLKDKEFYKTIKSTKCLHEFIIAGEPKNQYFKCTKCGKEE